jgi:integrase
MAGYNDWKFLHGYLSLPFQELAGHSDIRTTQRYYVKVQPELIEKARKAIELSVAKNESE